MAKVIDANATYTGGGIYIYTGQLDDGTFFMTNTEYLDYIMVLDVDPEENWDDNCDEQWQNEHMVVEYCGSEAIKITREALQYIISNNHRGNYSVGEIESELKSLEPQDEELEGKKVRIVFDDGTIADITGEIVFTEDNRIHIVRTTR